MGKRLYRSAITMAKVTLIFMNIWVLAVVLVVSLGHWRVFESAAPDYIPDNSHLVVMRELKEEGDYRMVYPTFNGSRPDPVILQADFPQEDSDENNPQPAAAVAASSHKAGPMPVAPKPASPVSVTATLGSDRVQNLRHWCNQQHPDKVDPAKINSKHLTSILVDEKHKLLYCQVPGVVQNDWRKLLLVLTGVVNTTNPSAISGGDVYGKYGKSVKHLSDFPVDKRVKMLNEYFKIVFVRDPLERLLKAYDTKIASKFATYFHKTFGTEIIKKYRKNPKKEDLSSGNNVKFNEFAQFIVGSEYEGKATLNEHWSQYYKQCHPCNVQYDFVGKFETASEDVKHVLKKLNIKTSFKGPLVTDVKSTTEGVLKKQYGLLNGQTLNNLYKLYSADYTLFGYKCPKFLHELMEKNHVSHDY